MGDLVCSENSRASTFQQPLRRRSCMRLRFWNSRTTWRGWQGRAWAQPRTHAGCIVSRCCTPPMSSPPGQTPSCFPPCRNYHAASMNVHVAQLMWAGSSSRGLACGIAGESCCRMMWRLRMLGSTTTSTKNLWISCWSRPIRASRWPRMWCPKISMHFSSDVQRVTLGNWAWASFSSNGGPGCDVWARTSSCRISLSRVTSPGPPGGDPGRHGGGKVPGLIELFVAGWKAKRPEPSILGQPARSAAIPPGACVGPAASACVVTAIHGGSRAQFVEAVRRCLLKVDTMTEEAPLESPQHLFALRTLAILLGCSAMASGGKGYYAAQAAASSSSGGDLAPGWRAADSLMMIAAQRARQWREAEGLLDDDDFAYAYTDYDQVVGLAGHHVADDWLQTRARGRRKPSCRWSQSRGGPPQGCRHSAPSAQDDLQEEAQSRRRG